MFAPGRQIVAEVAAQLPEGSDEVERLFTLFTDYYVEHPVDFTRWTPGAQEALDTLAELPDMALALCTNKPRATTEAVLSALGVRTRFRAIVAGGDLLEKKPAPGPLLHLSRVLHVGPDAPDKALSHPAVTMLGHATGRLLLKRDGYKINLDEVLRVAAANRKMIEINAHAQGRGAAMAVDVSPPLAQAIFLVAVAVMVAASRCQSRPDSSSVAAPSTARSLVSS